MDLSRWEVSTLFDQLLPQKRPNMSRFIVNMSSSFHDAFDSEEEYVEGKSTQLFLMSSVVDFPCFHPST